MKSSAQVIGLPVISIQNGVQLGQVKSLVVNPEKGTVDFLNVIPIANELVNKKIAIKQAKVMTRKGQLLGEATEFYIDEESGQIIGIEVQNVVIELSMNVE